MRYLAGRIAILTAGVLLGVVAPAAAERPDNDDFARAHLVQGEVVQVATDNAEATREEGEPKHRDHLAHRSVWYRWVAPESGTVQVYGHTPQFSLAGRPIVAAYTGLTLGTLEPVARADTPSDWERSGGAYALRFRAVRGTAYHFALDNDDQQGGPIELQFVLVAPPPNDDFAAPHVLSGPSVTRDGDSRGSTTEPGEPPKGSAGSIWYRWTAPASDAAATLEVSGGWPWLGVYTGDDVAGLSEVGWTHPTRIGATRGRVSFRARAGATYRFQVAAQGHFEHGAVRVGVTTRPPPGNDAFADATTLPSAATASSPGYNDGATAEPGEPAPIPYWGKAAENTVWYSWTAPADGSLTIRADAKFSPIVSAFTGDRVDALTPVAQQPQDSSAPPGQIRIRVREGLTYRIAVDAYADDAGDFSLGLSLIPQPANDDFEQSRTIAGTEVDVDGSTVGATQQECEPGHDGSDRNARDPSVWYSWTAPATGGVKITARGDFRPVVAVYRGDSLCALERVEPTQNMYSEASPEARFRAEAGVTYRIAVDGYAAQWGSFALSLRLRAPPHNDAFALAAPLSGAQATATGDNIGATAETGEPWPNDSRAASVWYAWRAPANGVAVLRLPAKDFDARLAVYTGSSVGALTDVGQRTYPPDALAFDARAGTTYRIEVDSGYRPKRGDFELRLDLQEPPPNDGFARAAALSGSPASADGTNTASTLEPGEPQPSMSGDRTGTVWYGWTAPAGGKVTVRLTRGAASIGTYAGASVGSLTRVATSQWGPNRFVAEAGRRYWFAVAADPYVPGTDFTIEVDQSAPPNDDLAQATSISGAAVTVRGSNRGGTAEAGEPDHGWYSSSESARNTVWYRWTAPAEGSAMVRVGDADFDAVHAVYTGSSVGSLAEVASSTSEYALARVRAGVEYLIAVDGETPNAAGSFALGIEFHPKPANDDLSGAEDLPPGGSASVSGTTAGATFETGEPAHGWNRMGFSVWYRWTPLRSGDTTIWASGHKYNPVWAVYAGTSGGFDSLTKVHDDARYDTFRAEAGRTYWIAVDSACCWWGPFSLSLTQQGGGSPDGPPPAGQSPPAGDAPPAGESPPAGDAPGAVEQQPGAGEQPGATRPPAEEPAGPAGSSTAPAQPQPQPLALDAAFRSRSLSAALAKGLSGRATCTKACRLEAVASVDRATANRLGRAKLTIARAVVELRASRPATVRLLLPGDLHARLRRLRSVALTVRATARSGAERASGTWRVSVRR
ncbi:MAG TPA: hypothetical protein VF715_05345 [Thermoleophilaceae bacterium]|jgi:hypothetical protein